MNVEYFNEKLRKTVKNDSFCNEKQNLHFIKTKFEVLDSNRIENSFDWIKNGFLRCNRYADMQFDFRIQYFHDEIARSSFS